MATNNLMDLIRVFNDSGRELWDMLEEYQELDKNSQAAKAIEFYIRNGPYSKHLGKRFKSDSTTEELLEMVLDTPECCIPESEFLQSALELIAGEFDDMEVDKSGRLKMTVENSSYKVSTTTSKLIKFSIPVRFSTKDIRDEYLFEETDSWMSVLKSLLESSPYSQMYLNRILKNYMNQYTPNLLGSRCLTICTAQKACHDDGNFTCEFQINFIPSRANFETVEELHKLVDYVVSEYGYDKM